MSTNSTTTVLVTGGSGFLGSYVILALLQEGYTVRTTVRNLSREAEIRGYLQNGGATASSLARLTFIAASLESDEGWDEAVKGCKYVQHVASPLPPGLPKHEDELIIPARDGTLRVLKAAAAAGVKRVVITSSIHAVFYGRETSTTKVFTEEDWTVLDSKIEVKPYNKSKTIAEKAAWAFIASDANTTKMELVTTLPTYIAGPVLSDDFTASILTIKKLIDGSMPGCPNVYLPYVDVRDLASLQLLAMTKPEGAGQRFLALNGDEPILSMLQLGQMIKAKRPQLAKKIPSIQLPNFLVHIIALFDKPVALILKELGVIYKARDKKARELLGWKTRSVEDTILDTVDSLVKYKLV